MSVLVSHLKHAARRLQRSIERGDVPVLGIVEDGEALQRRHCLQAVSIKLGFRSWTHTRAVLERTEPQDLGTLMYRDNGGAIANIWSASYQEARSFRAETRGFLLPYVRQFQVVRAPYIRLLGLDPADPDWEAMGRDWVRPADVDAWTRITLRRVEVACDGGLAGDAKPCS